MSRKPVHKLRSDENRDAVWSLIRQIKGQFTSRQIQDETRLGAETVNDYLIGLSAAGYLEAQPGQGRFISSQYRLLNDTGVDAPRVRRDGTPVTQGQGRLQMWNTLRVLRDFSPKDLAFNASTEVCPVAEGDAKHFVQYLHAAGYLVQTGVSTTRSQARYSLIAAMWSGPRPPQIQRLRQVYDPNLRRVIYAENGGDE